MPLKPPSFSACLSSPAAPCQCERELNKGVKHVGASGGAQERWEGEGVEYFPENPASSAADGDGSHEPRPDASSASIIRKEGVLNVHQREASPNRTFLAPLFWGGSNRLMQRHMNSDLCLFNV
jgi:hypothetical protein